MSTDLKTFAEGQLRADKYPEDHHVFTRCRCDACGSGVWGLTVEHHSGSQQGDFKGIIRGACLRCDARQQVFAFSGSKRELIRTETPTCDCGHPAFAVGICERIEGENGLKGFFDEGVVVGQCAQCGKNRVVVFTD